jgi:serine/threonine protein kinase
LTAATGPLDPWANLLLAKGLGDYELKECIGQGHFGFVFAATNRTTSSRVAVKVLGPGAQSTDALDFDNEGKLLQRLNGCDGVISYVDGGTETITFNSGGIDLPLPIRYHVLTLASASAEELTLNPDIRNGWDWAERLGVWRGAVKGVHQMHLNGVAHRDLKSSNVLLMIHGKTVRARLGDLGRSRNLNLAPTLTAEEYLIGRGDLSHAPPEFLWFQGGATAADFLAADYYGLGSLLVELVTGHPISSLAMGNFRTVVNQAHQDHQLGLHGDLSALRARYRTVIAEAAEAMPVSIRSDARIVLANLCDPLPSERLRTAPFSHDRLLQNPLEWVLRRADIMIHRIQRDAIEERRNARRLERSA